VEEIFQTFLTSKEHFTDAIQELSDMTPLPMNTMLEKQPRAEAILKRAERKSMTAKDIPPTGPGI